MYVKIFNSINEMLVSGHNYLKVLCAESNNNSVKNPPAISPPLESILDIPSLLSYSVYDEHAIIICRDGRGFVVGNGIKGRVIRQGDSSIYEKITQLELKDDEGNECNFISAVCGTWYTFYLLQSHLGDKTFKLAFSYYNTPNEQPLFLNLGERNPIAIYGGHTTAAALCEDGSVFILTEGMFRTPNQIPPILVLPNNEKIISVGCMEELFIVLSEKGKLYKYVLPYIMPQYPPLTEIEDLNGVKIVQLSATAAHCLAVADDGRVFGWGLNESGRIGVQNNKSKVPTFTEITALKDYKIRVALAGCYHSLFLTNKGRVLASGVNYDGELMLTTGPSNEDVLIPTKTTVHHGATFGMAGIFLSALFVGCNPPPNQPNKVNKGQLPLLPDPNFNAKLPSDVEFLDSEEFDISGQSTVKKVKNIPVTSIDDLDGRSTRKSSAQNSDAHKSSAQNSDAHKSSAQNSDAHKSSAQNSDAHKSSAQNSDAHKSSAQNSDAHKSSAQRSGAHRSSAQNSEAHRSSEQGQSSELKPLPSSSSSRVSSNNEEKRQPPKVSASTRDAKRQPPKAVSKKSATSPAKVLESSNVDDRRYSSGSRLSMSSTFGEYTEVAGLRQQILEMKELLDSKDKEIYRLTMLNEALIDNDKSLQSNLGSCWDNQQSKIDEIDVLMTKKRKSSK